MYHRKKQLKDRVKKWGFVKNRKGGARSSSQGSNSLEPVNELEDSQSKKLSASLTQVG